MKHGWILAALFTLTCTAAHAQKIRVRKVKGNQALVEITGSTSLRQGASYDLISPDEFGDETETNNRKYVIGLNFAMTNTKSDAANSVSTTMIDFRGRFGWNFGNFELGPVLSYAGNIADVTATTIKGGGFADWNIISNIPGEAFIYGLGTVVQFGQYDPGVTSTTASYKYDLIEMFGGPFVKWFPTGGPYGFRLDVGYLYQRQSTQSLGNFVVSGMSASAGIFAYF